jgi:DNA-binding IclR family transcriptional regulator
MSKGKYYFSKSLEKGLKILSLFNRETPALTQSEIARTLGLNMTSTYRYTNTLVELGFLEKDARTKVIRPAVLCFTFCNNLMRATDHLHLMRRVVDRVHAEHNISIDVAFVIDDAIVRIYHKSAAETLTYRLPDSSRDCLHNTALGKAYLSCLSAELQESKVAGMDLTAKTERTITSRKALAVELKRIRHRGYAMCTEEYLPGLIAIAAPLCDPRTGEGVGAISFDFSTLQHSADDIEAAYAGLIRDVAASLSDLIPPDAEAGENVQASGNDPLVCGNSRGTLPHVAHRALRHSRPFSSTLYKKGEPQ